MAAAGCAPDARQAPEAGAMVREVGGAFPAAVTAVLAGW